MSRRSKILNDQFQNISIAINNIRSRTNSAKIDIKKEYNFYLNIKHVTKQTVYFFKTIVTTIYLSIIDRIFYYYKTILCFIILSSLDIL